MELSNFLNKASLFQNAKVSKVAEIQIPIALCMDGDDDDDGIDEDGKEDDVNEENTKW